MTDEKQTETISETQLSKIIMDASTSRIDEGVTVQVNYTAKQNSISFRYAGPGHEGKLYYEDTKDLKQQLAELADMDALDMIFALQEKARKYLASQSQGSKS